MTTSTDPVDTDPWTPRTTLPGERLGRWVDPGRAFQRFGEPRMRRWFDGTLCGDELAMRVVRDLRAIRGGDKLVDRALDDGIGSVPDAPESLKQLMVQVEHRPAWVDPAQLRRGAIAYHRPGPLVSLVFTCALVGGNNRSQAANREVAMTGRFLDKAFIRSQETFRWLLAASRPGGMERTEDGFRYTVKVRLLHARIRSTLVKSDRWDADRWGMPISDTQSSWAIAYEFATAPITAYQKIGFRFTPQELDDMYALWRYIGYVIGVPEQHLHSTTAEAVEIGDIYRSMDLEPDEICQDLVRCLIELATPTDQPPPPDRSALVSKLLPPLRMRAMLYGLIRYWCGDREADGLAVPPTSWKHLGHAIRPAVQAFELARRVLPIDDERIVAKSLATMDRSVELAPGGSMIAPPDEVVADLQEKWARDPR